LQLVPSLSSRKPAFPEWSFRISLSALPADTPSRHGLTSGPERPPAATRTRVRSSATSSKELLKPGDVFYIPSGVPHDGRNPGATKAALLSTFVAEQGKPLSTPVP
jgi:hypothetical protein